MIARQEKLTEFLPQSTAAWENAYQNYLTLLKSKEE